MSDGAVVLDVRFRLGPADREAGYYRYVPFEVPPGAPGVRVSLRYDPDLAVVDLGLFDTDGFRGWSGGERSDVGVGVERSTPGYLAGPLPPGEWRVVLGLYKLAPSGVPVEVTARLEAPAAAKAEPPPAPARPPRRWSPPAEKGRRWVAGDLHAHTVHSDGRLTVDQLAALAVSRGLDFLAVTDHNTVSHHAELPAASRRYGLTLLAGQEVTTPSGHANCFGDVGWVDFRGDADSWAEHAARRDGILSVNHPVVAGCSWQQPLSSPPPMVELWHRTWDRRSPEPLEWWRASGAPTPVGGSDFHRPDLHRLASPTTWVEIDDPGAGPAPAEGVLAALAAGRVAVTAGPDSAVLVCVGGEMVACGADGALLVDPAGGRTALAGERCSVEASPGLWTLADGEGRVLALCPVGQ